MKLNWKKLKAIRKKRNLESLVEGKNPVFKLKYMADKLWYACYTWYSAVENGSRGMSEEKIIILLKMFKIKLSDIT